MPLMLDEVSEDSVAKMSDADFAALLGEVIDIQQSDRKENQLLYYEPVSEHARQIHFSHARIVGVGGGNRACLPLTAPILMATGEFKPLGEVIVGDTVMAADPETGEAVPSKVSHTWRSGMQPVYRIKFSDGGGFEATPDHRVPLYLGSGRKTSKGNGKKPHKRRLGDYIARINRNTNVSKRVSAITPTNIRLNRSRLKIHPYLLGALIGDGGLSGKGVKFFNIDKEVIERVRVHAEEMGCELIHWDGPNFGISAGRGKINPIKAELRFLGLHGHTAHGKFIPIQVFGLSRKDRKEVLAGLIDTDGSVNSYSTVSERLAFDFRKLVISLGGKATISKRSIKTGDGRVFQSYGIYWRINEELPVCLRHKQPGNGKREVDYSRRICRSAKYTGMAECGDLTVEHPAHCYITEDYVVVSNSKTDTVLAHLAMCATGVVPRSLRDEIDLDYHFRGPVSIRVVVESLTTTLHQVILEKLKWWKWSGIDREGGERGHYGWIPKSCLIDGDWEKSWSEKLRTLTVLCRDPKAPDRVLGESTFQFMSHDQDPSDFASDQFHHIWKMKSRHTRFGRKTRPA